MKYLLKILHLISLSIFFGSIATFIFLGEIIPPDDLSALKISRELVASGTAYLTLPALFATGLTGILMSGKPKSRWLWSKVVGFILIALNTTAFIYPAIETSLLHMDSHTNGSSSGAFTAAMQQEAIFGGLNLLLIFSLIAIATIKPSFKRRNKATYAT
ncbi:MAG: hypothetical protein V7776_09880 [Halopseudomonas aestusnigri]